MAGKGIQQFTVQEAQNVGLGQLGSSFADASATQTPPTGCVFVAITFLDDTIFDASGGLIAENSSLFPNTEAAAHSGTVTSDHGSGGVQIDASNTFPKGATIYGRWTEIDITSGLLLAYIGK